MTDMNQWLETLDDILVARRVDVERVEKTLNVKAGRGITAAKANLDPAPLFEVLAESPGHEHNRLIAGYASGAKHVLLEPKRSKAAEWDYVESAGRMMPNVEVHTFRMGAEAAAGEPVWTLDFHEDLILAYVMELDVGMRVLTQSQFDGWSATADRVTSAARSLLFHKTRNVKPATLEEFDGVERIRAGDDYDAIRCIVVADVFFGDFDDSYRFSMPAQDALLFVRGHSDAELGQLRAATDAHFEAADYPLTRSIYAFETGRPVLDEERP